MIKGNRDLKQMEDLMGATNQVVDTHISAYDKLRTNILGINNEAEEAIKSLNFYDQTENNLFSVDEENEEASPTKEKKGGLKDKLYQIEPIEEEEDDFAM